MDNELNSEERIARLEERAKSNTHRIEQVENGLLELRELTTTVATMATELRHTNTKVEEIQQDVRSLTSKPAKRWDTLVDVIIGAIVGILAGFLTSAIL